MFATALKTSSRTAVVGLFIFLFGLAPISSAVAAEIYGMPAARVDQSRGVDKSVVYQDLAKMGLWDDRNYQLTAADLKYLSKNEGELSDKVPAFFRVEMRKMWPHLKKEGTVQYPRAGWQMFRRKYGGVQRNGKIWGPDFNANRVPVPVNGQVQLNQILGANEITVEINPANSNRVIAGSNNNGGQEMYYSSDGGVTWTIQGVLPNTCCDPSIDWSSDGSVAYVAALSGSIGVSFWRSVDQGVTWTDRVNLTAGGSDKEWVHVDRSPTSPYQDNVYLTYHDGNTMQFARSTDMGATFDIQAFNSAPSGIGSDITTTANGDIYYFYGAFGTNQIIMLKSTDGGDTFAPAVEVDPTNASFDWPIPSMESRNAWIYVAGDSDTSGGTFDGSIYASWTDTLDPESGVPANNHTIVKVAYSRDGGVTWTTSIPHPTTDTGTVDRFNQWMTVDEQGNVHVVYYDTQHSVNRTGTDLYYTISTDGGVTWNEQTRVSSATSANLSDGQEWGDYNGISVVGDRIVTTWTDNRDGPPNAKDVFAADLENIGASPNFTLAANGLDAAVCVPDSFDVAVNVGQIQDFSNDVTFSTVGAPAGVVVNFSQNPVAPGGSVVASVTVGGSVAAGNYSFDIVASANGVDDRNLNVNIVATDEAPVAANLVSPPDGAIDQAVMPMLTWDAVAQASSYTISVSTSAVDFAGNIVETGTSDTNSYAVSTALDPLTTYYWAVEGANTCGSGSASAISSFTTDAIICATPGLAITDNTTVSDTAILADAGVIEGLTVSIDAAHTWVGDLTFTLVHEDTSTSVVLMDRPGAPATFNGCSDSDVNAVFDDASSIVVETECSSTPPAIGGVLNPEGVLADFIGESLGGTWRLDVTDSASSDTGTLNQWCLLLDFAGGLDTDSDGVQDSEDNCIAHPNADQRDTNEDGYGNACDPDLNNDGVINFADVSMWVPFFGLFNTGDEDFNGDGKTDFGDYKLFPEFFLQAPGPSAVVPQK